MSIPSGLVPARNLRDESARVAACVTRAAVVRLGRGEGRTLPGRIAEQLSPGILTRASHAVQRVVLVSGTNGKTTTTALLSAALRASGRRVLSNATGSNLHQGLVTAVVCGKWPADDAVLEVDEAVLPRAIEELGPDVVVLLNLSRDQLDRHHEVRSLGSSWRRAVGRLPQSATVIAACEDPLVAYVAEAAPNRVLVAGERPWRGRDHALCPSCAGLLGPVGDGHWPRQQCLKCGWAPEAPTLTVAPSVHGARVQGFGGDRELRVPIQAPGYLLDASLAWAAAVTLGVPGAVAAAGVASVREVQARYARAPWAGATVRLLLAKNPAGWDEALAVSAAAPGAAVVAINGRIPDGKDTSWLWDVEMQALAHRPVVVASGDRVDDAAVRLAAAGTRVAVRRRLADALDLAASFGTEVDVFADYTSFQEARRLLSLTRSGSATRSRASSPTDASVSDQAGPVPR